MKRRDKCLVGKYVCYGDENGGFVWGRICRESTINTIDGIKDVFILEDGMNCRGSGEKIRKFQGERILRRDVINSELDIIDKDGSLKDLGDEELFRASLGDMTALTLGVKNMAEAGASEMKEGVANMAADILKDRMGI